MGYLGLVTLEDTLQFFVQVRNGNNVASTPDGTPSYAIYGLDGSALLNGSAGASDHNSKTGYRRATAAITAANGFAVGGLYHIRATWAVSGTNYVQQFSFNVV